MPFSARELIIRIGGDQRPGEKLKGYLNRVAEAAGIGPRSAEEAWKDQYASKNTKTKLQQAAENENVIVATKLESAARALLALEPKFYREEAERLRGLARGVRALDRAGEE